MANRKTPAACSPLGRKTYTITYGDVAENHARMQKIGVLHERGYNFQQMRAVQTALSAAGVESEMHALHDAMRTLDRAHLHCEPAWLLVIRRGAQHVLETEGTVALMAENDALDMDKHALMRGRVVNKRAMWNLCFDDGDQEPDYASGKGRVVAWAHIPLMKRIRNWIAEVTADVELKAEANYYFDIDKCGIGFHGDGERRKVFAVRMGAAMPIHFQWFHHSEPVGQKMVFDLHDGDMYMMSEKAVGFDWRKSLVPTLRHATGCATFTTIGAHKTQDPSQITKQREKQREKQDPKQDPGRSARQGTIQSAFQSAHQIAKLGGAASNQTDPRAARAVNLPLDPSLDLASECGSTAVPRAVATRVSERRTAGALDLMLPPEQSLREFLRLLRQQKRVHDALRSAAPASVLLSDLYTVAEDPPCAWLDLLNKASGPWCISPRDTARIVQHPCDKDVLEHGDGTTTIHESSVLNSADPICRANVDKRGGGSRVLDDREPAEINYVVLFVGPVAHVQVLVIDLRVSSASGAVFADAFDADGARVSEAVKRVVEQRLRRQVAWLDVNAADLQQQRSGAPTLLCAHLSMAYAWLRVVEEVSAAAALSEIESARYKDDREGLPLFEKLISRVRDGRQLHRTRADLQFRSAACMSDADLALVLQADQQCWERCGKGHDRWSAESVRQWARASNHEVVVAHSTDGLPAGYMLLEHEPEQLFIFFLCSTPASQRRGVGRACLEFAASVARAARHDRVDLCVHPENGPAIALYESAGFFQVSPPRSNPRVYSRVGALE